MYSTGLSSPSLFSPTSPSAGFGAGGGGGGPNVRRSPPPSWGRDDATVRLEWPHASTATGPSAEVPPRVAGPGDRGGVGIAFRLDHGGAVEGSPMTPKSSAWYRRWVVFGLGVGASLLPAMLLTAQWAQPDRFASTFLAFWIEL